MKRVLVTGGFGFLGSHLLEVLLEDPLNRVLSVDNLTSNPLPQDHLLAELPASHNFKYVISDVQSYCSGSRGQAFDEIYHLASPVGPAGVLQHAGRIAGCILNDALVLADKALRCGARMVFVSSSEVYGGGQDGLCSESMPSLLGPQHAPRTEYAAGKLAAEAALLNLARVEGLDLVIIRPFNVAGPRQSGRGGFVLPRFIGQALASKPITVFGGGTQKRSFSHVRDIVSGIISAARRGKSGEVYNLGNPDNLCTILALAEDVKAVAHASSEIVMVDPTQIYGPLYAEANDKYPDSSKSQRELGWRPRYNRQEVIEDTYRYMSQQSEPILTRLRGF